MNIEILKAYYPYGLCVLSEKYPTEPCRIRMLDEQWVTLQDPWDKLRKLPADSEEYRPLLYPLSYLNTPIRIRGGRQVVPLDLIGQKLSARSAIVEVSPGDQWFRKVIFDYLLNRKPAPFTHEMMKMLYHLLYRFHFDLDRLIETGQGIDVTTLAANPYDFYAIDPGEEKG